MIRLRRCLWLAITFLAFGLTSCNIGKAPEPTTDVSSVYTSVAGTMISQLNGQLTQTAQAVPPAALASPTELSTLAPLPTTGVESTLPPLAPIATGSTSTTPLVVFTPVINTPLAGGAAGSSSTAVGCADSIFVQDVTIPDGTVETAGTVFTKIWRMQNTGTCTWGAGFKFVFASGSKMDGEDFTINLSKDFVAAGSTKDFGIKLIAPSVPNTYTGCWKMQTDQGYWFGGYACVTIKVSK
ncbi:MAG: NBR1-Ig-like domain-containing protein [Anaerolineales bacterium]